MYDRTHGIRCGYSIKLLLKSWMAGCFFVSIGIDAGSAYAGSEGLSATTIIGTHSTSTAISAGDSATDLEEGLAFDIGIDYRTSPRFSWGAVYFNNAYALPDGIDGSMKFHGFLLAPRWHTLAGPVDLALEVGFGWNWLTSEIDTGVRRTGFSASGLALAAGLGASYPVTNYLDVGFLFRMAVPAFTELCVPTPGSASYICGTPSSNMKDTTYGVSVAINISALTGSAQAGRVKESKASNLKEDQQ
jgi:hypothetical protein